MDIHEPGEILKKFVTDLTTAQPDMQIMLSAPGLAVFGQRHQGFRREPGHLRRPGHFPGADPEHPRQPADG